jgi:hypothetical protein
MDGWSQHENVVPLFITPAARKQGRRAGFAMSREVQTSDRSDGRMYEEERLLKKEDKPSISSAD